MIDYDYLNRLIAHRVPELSENDLAAAASQPVPSDDMVPVSVLDQVLDLIIALEGRMSELEEEARAQRSDSDPVDQVRRLLVDMPVEEKAVVVDRLQGWIEYERSTHEQRH